MPKKQILNYQWDDLPLLLGVSDIAKILRIGQAAAYKLTEDSDFPSLKIGRVNKVYRDSLKSWLENSGRCSK